MAKPLAFAQVLILLAFIGCATARYKWNLAHEHLSANVQQMPLAEIQQITRLVSEKCGEPIICIHRIDSGPYAGEIWVVAGNTTTMQSSDNALFQLKKRDGVWRIIDWGYGFSTSLINCGDT